VVVVTPPLPRAHVGEFIAVVAGRAGVEEPVAERFFRLTGGNPFFLQESVGWFDQHRQGRLDQPADWGPGGPVAQLEYRELGVRHRSYLHARAGEWHVRQGRFASAAHHFERAGRTEQMVAAALRAAELAEHAGVYYSALLPCSRPPW
jgi:hypothetical protein